MFNFSTTTILNSDKDKSGKALFSSLAADNKHGAILKIKNDFTFEMPGIAKVYKKVAAEPVVGEFTIDCDKLISALPQNTIYPVTGRISVYMALEGSEESLFANDFYQKGHPFSIGFIIENDGVSATELANSIKRTVNKFNVAMLGRKMFEVSASAGVLTFKCTDEYMRFKAITIRQDLGHREGEIAHLFDGELDNTQDIITIVNRGTNGFGTFRQLSKDISLPTAMNTGWTAITPRNRPVPGALYNQYIIDYVAPSHTNPSLVAVGHKTNSHTTHVFWVRQDFAAAFEAVIAEVVGSAAVKDDRTAIFEEV